jgi:hypothetical protein
MQYGMHDNSIQQNAAIELQDSQLMALCLEPSAAILDFRAYVHRSHGTPGIDPGTVWVQPAAFILLNGHLQSAPRPDLPCTIADGDVTADDQLFENMIPCPFVSESEAAVNLTLASGHRLQIDADQLTIEFTGEPEFLEDYHGH